MYNTWSKTLQQRIMGRTDIESFSSPMHSTHSVPHRQPNTLRLERGTLLPKPAALGARGCVLLPRTGGDWIPLEMPLGALPARGKGTPQWTEREPEEQHWRWWVCECLQDSSWRVNPTLTEGLAESTWLSLQEEFWDSRLLLTCTVLLNCSTSLSAESWI